VIAVSSFGDLSSLFGAFDQHSKYLDSNVSAAFAPFMLEYGQTRMGAASWADIARYQRNSPIFAADRIKTPLMLIHGDLDYIPIGQAEEMYTALRRTGTPVSFLRLWGEGHSIEGAPNVRAAWAHIFAWLAQHGGL
jgi:dipeptidyl aminopeptidase/acylaminoacyl peptidase